MRNLEDRIYVDKYFIRPVKEGESMAFDTLKLPQKLWLLTDDFATLVDREYLPGFMEDLEDTVTVICQQCCHTQTVSSSGCCNYCGRYLGDTYGDN